MDPGRIRIVQPPAWLKLLPAGVPVFPAWGFLPASEICSCPNGVTCKDAGKHPLTANGLTDATTDPVIIAKWNRQWPTAHWGAVPGAAGYVVIDTDTYKGADLDALRAAFGDALFNTYSYPTLHGGEHRWLKLPSGVTVASYNGRLAPYVDVKSTGGYVVLWWLLGKSKPNDAPILDAPPALVTALLNLGNSTAKFDRARAEAGVGHGLRQDTMFRLACSERSRGASIAEAKATVHAAAAKCDPVYDDEDLDELVDRVFGRYPQGFHLTDTGNAEYFAYLFGNDVRYDHRRGRWLLWEGHRWVPDDDAAIDRLAIRAMRRRLRDATEINNNAVRDAAVKWAMASEARAKREALLALARTALPIADAGNNWDADPMLLGVPNGVVDLRTGALRDGRREDRMTMSTAVAYDPDARAPRWEQFVAEVFDNDKELIDYVHRGLGYSISGNTEEQCLFIGYGEGANGKSTMLNTIARHVLGDYGHVLPFSALELYARYNIPNDLAGLVGKRFVMSSETQDAVRLNESRIRALTGCDPLSARFLYHEFFTFKPVGKYWLALNHLPIVKDDSHATWRRMRVLPFLRTFPLNDRLADELRAEAAGILNWLVKGCLEHQSRGLKPPPSVTQATDEYRQTSDQLAEFIGERCIEEREVETQAAVLYRAYVTWANLRGLDAKTERLSSTMFGRKLGARYEKTYHPITRSAMYKGIRLATFEEMKERGLQPPF